MKTEKEYRANAALMLVTLWTGPLPIPPACIEIVALVLRDADAQAEQWRGLVLEAVTEAEKHPWSYEFRLRLGQRTQPAIDFGLHFLLGDLAAGCEEEGFEGGQIVGDLPECA